MYVWTCNEHVHKNRDVNYQAHTYTNNGGIRRINSVFGNNRPHAWLINANEGYLSMQRASPCMQLASHVRCHVEVTHLAVRIHCQFCNIMIAKS